MKLFITIICSVNAVVVTLNQIFLFSVGLLWINLLGMLGGTILMITLDGTISAIAHKNRNRLNPFSKFFRVTQGQKDFLTKLGIKRIKAYVPDLGNFVKFPKGKIVNPRSPEYIYTYIIESCVGELGHWISAFVGLSYIAVFAFEPIYCLVLGVPVALTNFTLMLIPASVLRYNRCSLEQLYNRLVEREKAAQTNN